MLDRPMIDCPRPVWVPFMSGYGGITVAMFPQGIVYYYFSDAYDFSWRSAILAADSISALCPATAAGSVDVVN